MIELGQLERRHADFEKRDTRVVVVSVDAPEDARRTQEDFPHLLVLADSGRGLSDAAGLVDPGAAPDGSDVDRPTTVLIDRGGTVRWVYRSPAVIARLSPDEVLRGIDEHLTAP